MASRSLPSSIAAELSLLQPSSTRSSENGTEFADGAQSNNGSGRSNSNSIPPTDESTAVLSQLVEATIGASGELDDAVQDIVDGRSAEGSFMQPTSAEECDALAQRAAARIVAESPLYDVLRKAVVGAQSSATTKAKTEDVSAVAAKKRPKCSNNMAENDAVSCEVWDVIDTSNDGAAHDPFAAASSATSSAAPVAAKSFSLFDMLDSQQTSAPIAMERVGADDIVRAFARSPGNGEAASVISQDQYASAASLLERVDDMEDLLFDPFGSGGGADDLWPGINGVLRTALGLKGDAVGDTASTIDAGAAPPSDIIVRFAKIHSQLNGLCGKSSSTGIDFGPQRIDLMINLADGIVAIHNRGETEWSALLSTGDDIHFDRSMAIFVETLIDLIKDSVGVLEMIPREDCHRFLSSLMNLLAVESKNVTPAHALASADPYADWFTLLSRFVPPDLLIKTSIEAGMIDIVLERCNGKSTIASEANGTADGRDMVSVGSTQDLDHCLFLQTLSILRTLLVVTAGSDKLFPYQRNVANGPLTTEGALRFLSPFVNVLRVGVSSVGDSMVDEILAGICDEASHTILWGLSDNAQLFQSTFESSVGAISRTGSTNSDDKKSPSVSKSSAASRAIARLQQIATR